MKKTNKARKQEPYECMYIHIRRVSLYVCMYVTSHAVTILYHHHHHHHSPSIHTTVYMYCTYIHTVDDKKKDSSR